LPVRFREYIALCITVLGSGCEREPNQYDESVPWMILMYFVSDLVTDAV